MVTVHVCARVCTCVDVGARVCVGVGSEFYRSTTWYILIVMVQINLQYTFFISILVVAQIIEIYVR